MSISSYRVASSSERCAASRSARKKNPSSAWSAGARGPGTDSTQKVFPGERGPSQRSPSGVRTRPAPSGRGHPPPRIPPPHGAKGTADGTPDAGPETSHAFQRFEDGMQPLQERGSVIQMVFPCALNSTRSARRRMRKSPRPIGRRTAGGEVGSGTSSGSKPGPSSVTCSLMDSSVSSATTLTLRAGSPEAPNRIPLVSASDSSTRSRKRVRWLGASPAKQCRTMSSTASSTQRRAARPRSSTDRAAATPVAAGVRRTHRRSGAARSSPISEPREGFLRGGRDVEEGVELGELEEGAKVLVEPRDPELSAQVADLLRQGDQRAEPRRIDIAGLAAVDQEAALAPVEALLHQRLQLRAVAHDELAVDPDDGDAGPVGRLAESHRVSSLRLPAGRPRAWRRRRVPPAPPPRQSPGRRPLPGTGPAGSGPAAGRAPSG